MSITKNVAGPVFELDQLAEMVAQYYWANETVEIDGITFPLELKLAIKRVLLDVYAIEENEGTRERKLLWSDRILALPERMPVGQIGWIAILSQAGEVETTQQCAAISELAIVATHVQHRMLDIREDTTYRGLRLDNNHRQMSASRLNRQLQKARQDAAIARHAA